MAIPTTSFLSLAGPASHFLGYNGASGKLQYSTTVDSGTTLFSVDDSGNIASAGGLLASNVQATNVTATGNLSVAGKAVVPQNTALTTYTSTISAASGTISAASGDVQYEDHGKRRFFNVSITVTTNGTGSGALFATLPTAISARECVLNGREAALNGKTLNGLIPANSNQLQVYNYDNSYPGANGARLTLNGSCALS